MIDCHCHLADEEFANDIDEVIDRAKQSGVTGAIVVAEFASDFDRVLQLSEMYQGFLFPCLGLHPVQVRNIYFRSTYKNFCLEKFRVRKCYSSLWKYGYWEENSPGVSPTLRDWRGNRTVTTMNMKIKIISASLKPILKPMLLLFKSAQFNNSPVKIPWFYYIFLLLFSITTSCESFKTKAFL